MEMSTKKGTKKPQNIKLCGFYVKSIQNDHMDGGNAIGTADGQVLFVGRQANTGQNVGNGRTVGEVGDIVVDDTSLAQTVYIVVLENIAQVLFVTGYAPQVGFGLIGTHRADGAVGSGITQAVDRTVGVDNCCQSVQRTHELAVVVLIHHAGSLGAVTTAGGFRQLDGFIQVGLLGQDILAEP